MSHTLLYRGWHLKDDNDCDKEVQGTKDEVEEVGVEEDDYVAEHYE